MNRREWIERSALVSAGFLGGIYAPRLLRRAPLALAGAVVPSNFAAPAKTTTVLSLKRFQQELRAARTHGGGIPVGLANLGGLNRISGFTIENDGDVRLFGDRDMTYPQFHVDDLAVSLRSAFLNDGVYSVPLGCTIDPDPSWSIQSVRVFGPPCRLTARAVKLDGELKFAGAGLVQIPGVRSSFELRQSAADLCDDDGIGTTAVTNRYWFCSLVAPAADGPRYEAGGDRTVVILKFVQVQALTERRLKAAGGSETGGTPDRIAELFARQVSAVLVSEQNPRREYQELQNDFRMVEVGALLRTRETSMDLDYLLHEHEFEPVSIPRYVSGIERKETSEVSCGGTITETATGIRHTSQMVHDTLAYRGGVDARVETLPEQFASKPENRYEALRARIQASQPDPNAWIWSLKLV